jgi:tetratricopeptide (TPR) repeat protein
VIETIEYSRTGYRRVLPVCSPPGLTRFRKRDQDIKSYRFLVFISPKGNFFTISITRLCRGTHHAGIIKPINPICNDIPMDAEPGPSGKPVELPREAMETDGYSHGTQCACSGRYLEAVRWFEQVPSDSPDYVHALVGKAMCLDRMGFFREAFSVCAEAVEKGPVNADAWFMMGFSLFHLCQYKDAISCVDHAVGIDSSHLEAWFIGGNCHYQMGELAEALHAYESIIEAEPLYAKAWYNKGVCLSDLGEYEEAIQAYESCLSINPGVAVVWTNKGTALASLGRFIEALHSFEMALEIDPLDRTAERNKSECERRIREEERAQANPYPF